MADSLEDNVQEFTEAERDQMARTYTAMLRNPATRELALRATKANNPQASIPEIDLKDAARAEFKKRDDQMAEMTKQLLERDARDRIRDERDRLKEAGHSKEDIAAIEKLMTEKQIPSYETAAEYFRNQNRVAEPAPYQPGQALTYRMPETELAAAAKSGKAGLSRLARESAASAMDDIRSGRIKLQ